MPAGQERLIALSLQKYELLKPLYRTLRRQRDSLRSVNQQLHRTLVLQDTALAASGRVISGKSLLLQAQTTQALAWKKRARSRWWLNVGLGAALLLLGAVAVR